MKILSKRNRSENKKTSDIKPRVYSLILLKKIWHTFLVILVAADQQLSSNGKNVENQKLTTSRKKQSILFLPLSMGMLLLRPSRLKCYFSHSNVLYNKKCGRNKKHFMGDNRFKYTLIATKFTGLFHTDEYNWQIARK